MQFTEAMTNCCVPYIPSQVLKQRLLLVIGVLLLSWVAAATNVDSLRQELHSPIEDTTAVQVCIQLSVHYERFDLDSAYYFAQRAIIHANRANSDFWQAEAHNSMGIIQDYRGHYQAALQQYSYAIQLYRKLGDARKMAIVAVNKGAVFNVLGYPDSAETNYNRALLIAEANGYKQLRAYILLNLANHEYALGNLLKSVELSLESLRIKEALGDEEGAIYNRYHLGNCYLDLKIADKSLAYFNEALESSRALGDSMWIGDCYYNLALVHHHLLNDRDSALHFVNKAYKIRASLGFREGIVECLITIGNLWREAGTLPKAKSYLQEGLTVSQSLGGFEMITKAYMGLARIELGQNNTALARKHSDSAMAYAARRNVPKDMRDVYYLQMQVHRALGNSEGALDYYDRYVRLHDSLVSEETSRQIVDMETMYQVEKKDKELLGKQLKVKEQDAKLRRQQRQIIALGGGGMAVLLILFLILKNHQNRRKLHRQELARMEQKRELHALKAMVSGEEKERTRIAKDLHDGVSGLLSTVKLYFSSLVHANEKLGDDETFQKAAKLLDDSSVEVRKVAHNLMPEILMNEGLVNALDAFCENIRGSGMLKIECQSINMDERLPPSLELLVYRIVQELINNIIKHANATQALVQVSRYESLLQITVEDNGLGFGNQQGIGAGLHNIKNRLHLVNGHIDINSSHEMGTSVNIEISLDHTNNLI